MKIITVEIDHVATDLDGSVTHVTLNAQLEDLSWHMVEVALPSAEALAAQGPQSRPEGS